MDHVAEVVTQEAEPSAQFGRYDDPRYYLTCSCGYNGPLRKLFSVAIGDKDAHLTAAREKAKRQAAVA